MLLLGRRTQCGSVTSRIMVPSGVFCLLFVGIVCAVAEEVPVVSTPLGKISGTYRKSYNGREYSAFYGIPYAKAPIGELRFQEPQPVSPWSGIWNANTSDIQCVQIEHNPEPEGGSYVGEEDCLYLSVFVPRKQPQEGKLLDVIVHIHGGALMFGHCNGYAGPGFLMDEDVVYITFNYRVGIFGFLSTEDEIAPGNIGMKDQVAALKWINKYIKHFGGNPGSVTLTGLSAGGASVHYHYLSPLSKGLFHRGFSISGNALTPWVLQEEPLAKARFVGDRLGCPTDQTKALLDCIKQRPTRQIVEITRLFRPWLFNPFSPFGIVVEKAGKNKFLPEHPYLLLKQGKFYDVPWIVSLVSEEGLYPAADFGINEKYLTDLERRWYELAPHILDYNYTVPADKLNEVSKKIKKEYLKYEPLSPETYKELIDMMSDRLFCLSAEKSAKLQAHKSKSPVYFYYFSFLGDEIESFTMHFAHQNQEDGVSHGDDVIFMFTNPHDPDARMNQKDEQMKNIMVKMLVGYSATGKPSFPGVEWQPVSKDLKEPLMQLRIKSPEEIYMEDAEKVERHREFWDSLPLAENENLFPSTEKDEL